jgi:hypothetical protein
MQLHQITFNMMLDAIPSLERILAEPVLDVPLPSSVGKVVSIV